MKSLALGDIAADFTLSRDGGATISLSEFRGQHVVLYFYPKDDTSGCTKQACDFTAALPNFTKAKAVVIGISRDSVTSHEKFAKKHNLGIILASDPEGTVCQDYGVWVEKSMYGRKYFGIERSTFLISPEGKIQHIWRKVKVPGHVDEVFHQITH